MFEGPLGVGKSTMLWYLHHMAKMDGSIVFHIVTSDFVNQQEPLSALIRQFLLCWRDHIGQTALQQVETDSHSPYTNVWELLCLEQTTETMLVSVFIQLIEALGVCRRFRVLILVDDCNGMQFDQEPQQIKRFSFSYMETNSAAQHPIGSILSARTQLYVFHGTVVYATTSACLCETNPSVWSSTRYIQATTQDKFEAFVRDML